MARVKVVVSVGCSLCCKCASCICSTAALQLPRIDFFILEKLLQALREKSGVRELCKIAYQCVSGSLLLFSADSSSGTLRCECWCWRKTSNRSWTGHHCWCWWPSLQRSQDPAQLTTLSQPSLRWCPIRLAHTHQRHKNKRKYKNKIILEILFFFLESIFVLKNFQEINKPDLIVWMVKLK